MRRPLLALAAATTLFAASVGAATWTVAPHGDDAGAGTAADPWQTLQKAADTVVAGDVVIVEPGDYAGFDLRTSGAPGAWIRFLAAPGTRIVTRNPVTFDGINVENASWIEIAGFTVEGMPRNGIRAATGDHVTIRGNHTLDNFDRGIFTAFVDDLLITDNETSGAEDEHGIYVSNSGDRPVIRGNRIHGNNANGIHMNGDESAGGDGVISDALVEDNVIFDNGLGGGSGINCDGVQDSVIRNNFVLGNHAAGISLYQIDGGEPSTGNLVINNTIVVAADGRWGIALHDGAADNTLRNNIVLTRHPWRGSLDVDVASGSHLGLDSDHNVLADRITTDRGNSVIDLASWRVGFGQDAHSLLADEATLFVDPELPAGDYRLAADSPAIDAGSTVEAPASDFEGDPRPSGEGVDVGADERFVVPPCVAPPTLVLSDDTVFGSETHTACEEITVGPAYAVGAGGDLTLKTRGRVVLVDGFAVLAAGRLTVEIDAAAGGAEP